MNKKTYYVNIGTQEISQIEYGNHENYGIQATDDEIAELRAQLDDMEQANARSFFRALVPIMSYHHDEANDDYDDGLTAAFQMLYDLGDKRTKEHIDSIEVLTDRRL